MSKVLVQKKRVTVTWEDHSLEILGVSLPSVEFVEMLPKKLKTPVLPDGEWCSWYWLIPFYEGFGALSDLKGNIDTDYNRNMAGDRYLVRPVLHISLNNETGNFKLCVGDVFKFGGVEFEVVSDNVAMCVSSIGKSIFRSVYYTEERLRVCLTRVLLGTLTRLLRSTLLSKSGLMLGTRGQKENEDSNI